MYERIKKCAEDDAKNYNNFNNGQDRKYYLFEIMESCLEGGCNYNKPFILKKYVGSDQVILYKGNLLLYDSETDTRTKEEFINFVTKIYMEFSLKNK